MNGDVTGLQQGGLVRATRGPPRAAGRTHRAIEEARRAPCGVWAVDQPGPVDGFEDPTAVDPFERCPATGRTGIAAPCSDALRRRTSIERRTTSGRAPSWTSTMRSPASSGGSCRARRRPPSPRQPTLGVARRQRRRRPPSTSSQGAFLTWSSRSAAVTTTIRSTRSAAARRIDRPGEERPPADVRRELVDAAHPARRPGRDDDRRSRVDRAATGAQSRRGWAKIIRPATVWRTRVTATSRSLSM